MDLLAWLRLYYPAPLGTLLSLFIPAGLAQTSRAKEKTNTESPQKPKSLPPLTAEQSQVMEMIEKSTAHTLLLYGETGTGKTRVYLELVKKQLLSGKSAILLTPEIGLTPQLAQTFIDSFPDCVVILHSTLTPAQRRDEWLKVLSTKQPVIVIGPRSAIFSPVHNLGLIIIDECHDGAYKQEAAPYYQTTRVAAKLAELNQIKLILGTATPLVSDYYALASKGLPIARMQQLATQSNHEVVIETVNLKDRDGFSRSQWISNKLIEQLSLTLQRGGQSLVFLNRRGTARLVICHNCGWQALCPRCDLPLTYHGDSHSLRCHTCGFRDKAPAACPSCKSVDIVFKSVGTKTIVSELQRILPKARIMRFDSDTKKADRLEANYEAVKHGEVDILVGTQMLSKGLDLPKLELLGIIMADTSLSFPDFTAEERTYQMLSQVLGRVGRGHRQGHVVLQSFNPDGPVIQAAIKRDYKTFYQSQLLERKMYKFPPFYYLLKLTCSRASSASAEKAARTLADKIQASKLSVEIAGPSPAFIEKNNDKYQWQIILKSKNRSDLLEIIKLVPANWTYDIDPSNLL
jgi:primosomal protein N' (replication factor Y)